MLRIGSAPMVLRRDPREILFRSLLVVCSVVFALLLAETALRIAGFTFYLGPRAVHFGYTDAFLAERGFLDHRELLWVPEKYAAKVARLEQSRPLILFMGDSCTQYGNYDRALARIIEEKHAGRRMIGGNVGAAGWSTYQGLVQMRGDVVRIRPRVVTICFGWNDHWVGFGIPDRAISKIKRYPIYRARKLRLVQLLTKVVVATGSQEASSQRRVAPSEFRSNLVRMIRIARKNSIEPILITAPSSHEPGHEPAYLSGTYLEDLRELVPLHREYVSIVREVGEAEGVPVCDLYAAFEELPREMVRNHYFRKDGIHMTPAGDEKAAELLHELLEANGLCEKISRFGGSAPPGHTPGHTPGLSPDPPPAPRS
jgi:lysophospholipase L1-like esterase